jgi:hypothetical protein
MNTVFFPDSFSSCTLCIACEHVPTHGLRCQPAPILRATVGTRESWNQGFATRPGTRRALGLVLCSLGVLGHETYISSHIIQAFISPSYAHIRRSNWPLMAGRVSSKPRFSYPWDRGCPGSLFMRSLTASSQYGTLIVHRGQGFSIFQDDLYSTLPIIALLGRGLWSRPFFSGERRQEKKHPARRLLHHTWPFPKLSSPT